MRTAGWFQHCPATEKYDTPNEQWGAQQAERNGHFDYSLLAQSYVAVDHASFVYVILLQEGNFALYLQSLAQIVGLPWMFGFCQTHYSRWLPVRIRDMMSLLVNHPNIRAELCAGKKCCAQNKQPFVSNGHRSMS